MLNTAHVTLQPPSPTATTTTTTSGSSPPSKSRHGCTSCKAKRLKCDEARPACNHCVRRDIVCPGYATVFKWHAKGQTSKDGYLRRTRRRGVGRSGGELGKEGGKGSENRQGSGRRQSLGQGVTADGSNGLQDCQAFDDRVENVGSTKDRMTGSDGNHQNVEVADVLDGVCSAFLNSQIERSSTPYTGDDTTGKYAAVSDWCSMMDMELFSRPLVIPKSTDRTTPSPRPPQILSGESAIVLSPAWLILNSTPPSQTQTIRRPSVRGLLKSFYGVQSSIPPPLFPQDTKLVEYYFTTVSGIYSCFDSDLNPFRSIVGQMWTFSASMYYAIQSMAAAHLANGLPSMRKAGIDLHRQASQHLGHELSKYYSQSSRDEQALLVLLLLGLSAPWHRPGDLGLQYLRTARSLVHLHPAFNQETGVVGPLQELFEEAMVYWEMMISFVADPGEVDVMHAASEEDNVILHLIDGVMDLGNADAVETPHPWTGISPQSQILLARVGRLVRRVRMRSRSLRAAAEMEYLSLATALEETLLALQPDLTSSIVESGDHCTSASHFITMAQVTRDCGLLELYRTFPALLQRRLGTTAHLNLESTADFSIENFINPTATTNNHAWLTSFAIHILQTLESIPDSSNVRANQLLLLLIPAAELRHSQSLTPLRTQSQFQPFPLSHNLTPADLSTIRARGFARQRLGQLAVVLPMRPVRVMLKLLEEVWGRMDAGVEDVFWVDVMIEKGWRTVMG